MGDLLVDDITVFDVERGMIVPPICRSDNRIGLAGMLRHTATMGFPNAAVCEIISAFKGCMPVRDAEKADYKIQKVGGPFSKNQGLCEFRFFCFFLENLKILHVRVTHLTSKKFRRKKICGFGSFLQKSIIF